MRSYSTDLKGHDTLDRKTVSRTLIKFEHQIVKTNFFAIFTPQIEASFSNALSLFRFDSLFDYGNELRDPRAAELVNGYYTCLMNDIQPHMQERNRKRKEDGYLTYPYFIPKWLPNGIQTWSSTFSAKTNFPYTFFFTWRSFRKHYTCIVCYIGN